jgi:probable HAF family extracellular repeat protein
MPAPPTLTIVSTAPVTNLSDAFALNDRGQVAGQEDTVFPFIWTPTVPNGITGTSRRLPLLPVGGGPAEGTVTAINTNGDAVGFADALDPSGTNVTRAVFWPATGGVHEIGTLVPSLAPPGFLGNSMAFGINDHGVIVGVSDSVSGVEHAFILDPAVAIMRDLGSLVPLTMLPGTPDPSRALAINNQGDIVGEAAGVDSAGNVVSRAFVLPSGALAMQDLGTLLPDPANPARFLGESAAFAINDLGIIVGDSDAVIPATPSKAPAFFQIGSPPSGMLPAIGGARGVNHGNLAVGFLGSSPTKAFRFSTSSGATDLTTLVAPPGTGTVIIRAVAINAVGQIAVTAQNGSTTSAGLITP